MCVIALRQGRYLDWINTLARMLLNCLFLIWRYHHAHRPGETVDDRFCFLTRNRIASHNRTIHSATGTMTKIKERKNYGKNILSLLSKLQCLRRINPCQSLLYNSCVFVLCRLIHAQNHLCPFKLKLVYSKSSISGRYYQNWHILMRNGHVKSCFSKMEFSFSAVSLKQWPPSSHCLWNAVHYCSLLWTRHCIKQKGKFVTVFYFNKTAAIKK